MKKADLHLHSNCSDGSDTVLNLANKILKSDIDIISLTDHDTTDGLIEIEKYLTTKKFIKGIELTCLAGDIKCHILGYGINPECEELKSLIAKGKILRRQKLETRIKYLKDIWNIELTKNELNWLYSRKSVVKTHLANILVNRGLAKDNLSAMRKYLDDCKTGNTKFDGEEAINAIKCAGGVVVWAHPLGGEGETHISENELNKQLEKMKKFGIDGLECYYSRYNENEINFLVKTANLNNLYICGGSDYHGTNKDISLGRLNINNDAVSSDKLTVLKKLI